MSPAQRRGVKRVGRALTLIRVAVRAVIQPPRPRRVCAECKEPMRREESNGYTHIGECPEPAW